MEHINDQIRERAHAIWEEEGRPHGRHQEHWIQAAAEIQSQGGGEAEADSSGPTGQNEGLPTPDTISAIGANFPPDADLDPAAGGTTGKTTRKKATA